MINRSAEYTLSNVWVCFSFYSSIFCINILRQSKVWILFKKFNILSLDCEYLSLLSFVVDIETFQIQRCTSYWKDVAIKLHSALPCNIRILS